MKLDRNINQNGKGKYALINLRKIPNEGAITTAEQLGEAIIQNPACVEFGEKGSDGEFFVIKLKDAYAFTALYAYADHAIVNDAEYAQEIYELAKRSVYHPNKKFPD